MAKYNYDAIAKELKAELAKGEFTDGEATEITKAGAEIIVKAIQKRMVFKKGYSRGRLKIISSPGDNGITNIGWNDYYGPMVENGTSKMVAQPHMRPGFNESINEAQRIMVNKMKEIIK